MQNYIKLLPDRIANQIAAGEVVQRPSSVVKELLENAIDADAKNITLIIKEAGKELVQVIDDGKGMSAVDARMCFERHATSKISATEDLFAIKTMGFRGEAMASIAAVAHVSLQSKTEEDEAGTEVFIEGSVVKSQNPIGCLTGTNISVKNLFYNIPARRKFLKSNTVEMRHIIDEFTRVALAYPNIQFKLIHNNTEQFNLRNGSLKTRIVELLGGRFDKQLIDVIEHTDYVKIYGFVGKPEAATKTRGNQYFFINNRFIRSPYLQHAVTQSYHDLINKDEYPFFVLFFEMDPAKVDVNVHPTKQEVKFEDEQILYTFLFSSIKHSLGRYNIAPSIDFTLDQDIQKLSSVQRPFTQNQKMEASSGFAAQAFQKGNAAHFLDNSNARKEWEQQRNAFFDTPLPSKINNDIDIQNESAQEIFENNDDSELQSNILIWRQYIVTTTKSELLYIHIQRALERLAYDELLEKYEQAKAISQQLIFPEMLETTPVNAITLKELIPELLKIGFDIQEIGMNAFAINGHPELIKPSQVIASLNEIIDYFNMSQQSDKNMDVIHRIVKSLAKRASQNWIQSDGWAVALVGRLFASSQPSYTPDGARIISSMKYGEIDLLF